MTISIRPAIAADAPAMTALINKIIALGGTTAHQRAFDAARMQAHYIAPPRCICCFVADRNGQILGFQALEWADPDWDGAGKLPADWAVIATFVDIGHQGMGIGSGLFGATLGAAEAAGVVAIDATIRADNEGGLFYYEDMGFEDYGIIRDEPLRDGRRVDRIRKKFVI